MLFSAQYAGKQCCCMALASIVSAIVTSPRKWSLDTLDNNMMEGHLLYERIRMLAGDVNAFPIPGSGYLVLRNFDVVKDDLRMFQRTWTLEYDSDPALFGMLEDAENEGGIGITLLDALVRLFEKHCGGIFIASERSVALLKYDDKFYFSDTFVRVVR